MHKSLCSLGPVRRRLAIVAAGAALVAAAHVPGGVPAAGAEPAATPPGFASPLEISNPLHPVVPGAVKVFAGREDGAPLTIVETHLDETRTFAWAGGEVVCRAVQRLEFVRGAAEARETSWFAQADDGSVWCFGEVDDRDPVDDVDEDQGEPGGWVVGALAPGDPEDLLAGAAPALVMPAAPRRGDEWSPEDHPPELQKQARALADAAVVRAAGARLAGCLRVREVDLADGGSVELRTYAPGIGLVATRERDERSTLRATTLGRR